MHSIQFPMTRLCAFTYLATKSLFQAHPQTAMEDTDRRIKASPCLKLANKPVIWTHNLSAGHTCPKLGGSYKNLSNGCLLPCWISTSRTTVSKNKKKKDRVRWGKGRRGMELKWNEKGERKEWKWMRGKRRICCGTHNYVQQRFTYEGTTQLPRSLCFHFCCSSTLTDGKTKKHTSEVSAGSLQESFMKTTKLFGRTRIQYNLTTLQVLSLVAPAPLYASW